MLSIGRCYGNSYGRLHLLSTRSLCSSVAVNNIAKQLSSQQLANLASDTPYNPNIRIGIQTAKFTVNISQTIQNNPKIDPVIGREDVIQRAIEILSRRTKNNPIFIGEPGVGKFSLSCTSHSANLQLGKTALAEELARKISVRDVPKWLEDKVVLALDLPSMLAGTRFRGEFEERLKGVLKEIEQTGDRIILFIDEIHSIAGAGGSEGAIDASNILKPALSKGQLRCVGATTTDEYRKYIEKDAALARRFQSVFVPEPTPELATKILFGLRDKFQAFHGILISDDALKQAVKLSEKYITERRFPDKAIDLLDEACSKLRIDIDIIPELSSEESAKAKADINIPQLWKNYKSNLSEVLNQTSQLDILQKEKQLCYLVKNHERIQYIDDIEMKNKMEMLDNSTQLLEQNLHDIKTIFGQSELLTKRGERPHILQAYDIAAVLTKQTGIPVGSLLEDEKSSLLNMEDTLNNRVIGQKEAIKAISKCIRLSRAGLRHHDRPLGVFLMIGGTGTGKTEIAKALSEFLFHDINATHMLRIDMSEYMEKFSISRLVGAPPGYVGYGECGALTESVRRRPFQVVLLDEFEKAHRDVSNLLLQVFDEGRLSDSQGRLVDFRNTVIIMTSNIMSSQLNAITDGIERKETAKKALSAHFAPEFVNRIDDIVIFNPLSQENIEAICRIQLSKVYKLLHERNIDLVVSDATISWISENGYQVEYGARPMKRLIQSQLLDPLATLLLEDRVKDNNSLYIRLETEVVNQDEMLQKYPIVLNVDKDSKIEIRISSGDKTE